MPLTGSRRLGAISGRRSRRQSRRIRLAVLISLLIHVAIGVLLLVTIRHEGKPELLPPPSAVTMLFESGRKNGPTLPNPDLQATPSTPPVPPSPPVEKNPLPTPPVPPPAESPAPPPPAVPTPPLPAPAEPPPPPLPAPAAPQAEVRPPPAEKAPLPPPPPAVKLPPRPPAVRPPPRQPAPPKPSDFPAPMNFTFGTPHLASPSPARPRSEPHIPGTIDMSLGPASRGAADATPFTDRNEEAEGADWRNALSRWVADHAYYPEQARRDAEEGDAKVHVVAEPNGRVKMVELVGKSGSMWLDLALLALFRDQQIPALPYGTKEPIDFNFTMHYVLIRPR
jgi:protein TonB